MKLKFKEWIARNKYFLLILLAVLIFFNPVFRGKIPFPGDLLASENPYRETSYLGFSPGGIPNKAQGPDVIKEIYPWRYFSVESLKSGRIPFWNPYNFSGNPQLANFQTAVFYPLNFIYFILPFNLSWTVLIMLQPALAGIFMYLFLKEIKLSNFSSFIGSLAFAFSSYMTVWIEYGNIGHTMLWFPLVLLLVRKIYKKNSVTNFLLLIFSLTMSFLGGYIQGFFYIYALSFFYFIYLTKLSDLKKLLYILFSFTLPFVIGAFQLLPTLELFGESTRGNYSPSQIEQLLLPINTLITIFAPDFFGNPATRNYYLSGTYIERVIYVGVPILFFVLYSLKKRYGEWKFFAISGFISLLAVTNLPFVKYLYQIPIPVISTTVPTRELSIFIFCAIILASFGINTWEKEKARNKIQYLFIFSYLTLWIGVFISFKFKILTGEQFTITSRNLILPTILALLTLLTFYKRVNLGKILLVFLVLFDLFYFFNKITPFSPKELIYPQTEVVSYLRKNAGINRFWGYGSAYIPANFQTVDKTFSPEGNDPLHVASYTKLLASSGNGQIPKVLPRPDANIAPGYGEDDLKNNFHRKRILDLLGIKYIVHKSGIVDTATFPKESYGFVWTDGTLQLYENKNALPRFFMANDYSIFKNKDEILSAIYDKQINLEKTILLEEEPQITISSDAAGEVKLITYEPNRIVFSTKSSGNSLLFLSDNYYPSWRARIDGKDVKLLTADYAFRALAVPSGEHTILMNHFPKSFTLGAGVSFFGIIIVAISIFFIRKYEQR